MYGNPALSSNKYSDIFDGHCPALLDNVTAEKAKAID